MDLFNARRTFIMFSICGHVQTLSIDWIRTGALITALLTLIAFIWAVFVGFNKKVSKVRYYEDLKELKAGLEKINLDLKYEIECKEAMNTRTHAEMKAEMTLSETRVKDEFRHSVDQLQTLVQSIDENVKIILGRKK
jgi:hypothetical protein